MREEEAIGYLEGRAADGAALQVAARGDFRSIKKLLEQCLDANIPSMLGPCTVSG